MGWLTGVFLFTVGVWMGASLMSVFTDHGKLWALNMLFIACLLAVFSALGLFVDFLMI